MFLVLMIVGQAFPAVAQFDSDTSYEVISEVPVVKSNFAGARKKALKIALRLALEQNLREILGDDEFEWNRIGNVSETITIPTKSSWHSATCKIVGSP